MGRAGRRMSSILQKNPKRVKEMLAPCQVIWCHQISKQLVQYQRELQVFSPQIVMHFPSHARATRDCVSPIKSSDVVVGFRFALGSPKFLHVFMRSHGGGEEKRTRQFGGAYLPNISLFSAQLGLVQRTGTKPETISPRRAILVE